MKYVLIVLAVWNIFTFSLYGIDKLKAKKHKRRISEANLLWCAFVMGGLGALLGQKAFHHKTQKTKFKILIPIAFILNVVLFVLFIAKCKGWI